MSPNVKFSQKNKKDSQQKPLKALIYWDLRIVSHSDDENPSKIR